MTCVVKMRFRLFRFCAFFSCGSLLAACGIQRNSELISRLSDVTGGVKPQSPPAEAPLEYPGLIPLDGVRPPAVDLVYQGEVLSPEKAAQLRAQGTDLSQLNPSEETDLWRNTLGGSFNADDDKLDVGENDTVVFDGFLTNLSSTKNARFGVRTQVGGQTRNFTLSLGRRAHDVLLRRSLLRKLGYLISPTKFVPRVSVRFNNIREVEIFKNRISEDTVGDSSRWIIAQPNELTLTVQDVVAVDAQVTKYNLANGRVAGRVGGRRIMRSLLVPFSLVSMGENANLFSWVPGRIFDRNVILNYENAEEFDCAREDAVWILRRIAALTRNDFAEIAQSANLPTEVALLLTEKLIARRNALVSFFNLGIPKIPFDEKISSGERLNDGKIVGENFSGHGERFSYGDPESPLSGQEIWAFIQSKAISAVISNGINYINGFLPNTDISAALMQHKFQQVNQAIQGFMTTGVFQEVPMGVFAIPMFGSQLVLSRDVVIGSYMGIENKVSVADTVGVNVSTGAYLGFEGLPVPVTVAGGAQAFYRRTYTHLKPIASLKAAVKSPFRNVIVPLLQGELANSLRDLNEETLKGLVPAARQQKIKAVISAFKDSLSVGESLLVTDSVGGDFSVQGGRNFYEVVSLNAGVGASHVVIGRMHIQRVSEDSIVISDGRGNLSSIRFTAGVDAAFVPVLRVGIQVSQGTSRAEVIPLSIDSDERRNSNLLSSIAAIRIALSDGSLSAAKQRVPGYTLSHSFRDSKLNEMFLFSRYAQISGAMSVEVRDNESGASKTFYQRRLAERWGTDFQSFFVDGINGILSGLVNVKFSIQAPVNDPAGSVGGKSFLREFVYEGVVEPASNENDIGRITEGFFSMQYRWRGWSMNRSELDHLVDEINGKYDWQFYSQTALGSATSIQFYDINAKTLISPEGLRSVVRHDEGYYRSIFGKYLNDRFIRGGCDYASNTHRDEYCRAFSQFLWFKARYGGEWARGNYELASSHLINAISIVENFLKPNDLIDVLGGVDNIFVFSRMEGFRVGDEAGDTALVGNTLGRLGSMSPTSPLLTLSKKLTIPVSEMMATWIRDSL